MVKWDEIAPSNIKIYPISIHICGAIFFTYLVQQNAILSILLTNLTKHPILVNLF